MQSLAVVLLSAVSLLATSAATKQCENGTQIDYEMVVRDCSGDKSETLRPHLINHCTGKESPFYKHEIGKGECYQVTEGPNGDLCTVDLTDQSNLVTVDQLTVESETVVLSSRKDRRISLTGIDRVKLKQTRFNAPLRITAEHPLLANLTTFSSSVAGIRISDPNRIWLGTESGIQIHGTAKKARSGTSTYKLARLFSNVSVRLGYKSEIVVKGPHAELKFIGTSPAKLKRNVRICVIDTEGKNTSVTFREGSAETLASDVVYLFGETMELNSTWNTPSGAEFWFRRDRRNGGFRGNIFYHQPGDFTKEFLPIWKECMTHLMKNTSPDRSFRDKKTKWSTKCKAYLAPPTPETPPQTTASSRQPITEGQSTVLVQQTRGLPSDLESIEDQPNNQSIGLVSSTSDVPSTSESPKEGLTALGIVAIVAACFVVGTALGLFFWIRTGLKHRRPAKGHSRFPSKVVTPEGMQRSARERSHRSGKERSSRLTEIGMTKDRNSEDKTRTNWERSHRSGRDRSEKSDRERPSRLTEIGTIEDRISTEDNHRTTKSSRHGNETALDYWSEVVGASDL